ncbi:50S ribosomal protein L21 [bacterium]|nr:MAG: 50S ribosomal protein L21 [bacterium]
MYAIVEISGMQFKVQAGEKVVVPYMEKFSPGDELIFDRVLLVSDGDDVRVGKPVVEGASVKAKLVEHDKGPKLIVFKKRRRKASQTKRGHREKYSIVEIDSISL